jgi:hypothetical protein
LFVVCCFFYMFVLFVCCLSVATESVGQPKQLGGGQLIQLGKTKIGRVQ